MATATNFGQSGVRTERTYMPAVSVRFAAGEFLHYKLNVSGAEALFSFDCEDQNRLTQSDFQDHPTDVYEWDLGVGKEQEPDSGQDVYSLGMLFTTAVKYTLVVDHLAANGQRIKQVIDVDYASTTPADEYSEPLTVLRHS
ncbi:MAG: hypothetical protein M3362_01850 [Acidobacteriota bacterium]|nr:hypothetical protein [Acidobacteriota bacterium]